MGNMMDGKAINRGSPSTVYRFACPRGVVLQAGSVAQFLGFIGALPGSVDIVPPKVTI